MPCWWPVRRPETDSVMLFHVPSPEDANGNQESLEESLDERHQSGQTYRDESHRGNSEAAREETARPEACGKGCQKSDAGKQENDPEGLVKASHCNSQGSRGESRLAECDEYNAQHVTRA